MHVAARLSVALAFGVAGIDKFIAPGAWIHTFEAIGLGQWFRYFTGGVEILGGLLFLVPAATSVGAFLLIATMLGAMATQAFVLRRPTDSLFPLIYLVGVVVAYVSLRSKAPRG